MFMSSVTRLNTVTAETIREPCHMVRVTRIQYGFWRFLSDTVVLHFDMDLYFLVCVTKLYSIMG